MRRYILKRLLQLIPVLLGVTFLSFAMMRLAGSDAITELYGDKGAVSQEIIDAKRAELGYQVTAVDYTASMLEEARRNAGALAGCIRFRQMNAEELTFPADSFDVVVTRNVTWNLRDPERAYGQWSRVLKPGGVLLNFDANWYRYLWDRGAEQAHARDRENLWASDVRDETAGTDVSAMEAIARQAPLSARMRPGWDLGVLRGLGLQAAADTEIWRQVWTREERINNASTPMFLVEARKCPLPQ